MQHINTIVLKMVKVSNLVKKMLMSYISIIGSGAFEKLNILEIFQDSYCAYRDLTIKSEFLKNIFLMLYLFTI